MHCDVLILTGSFFICLCYTRRPSFYPKSLLFLLYLLSVLSVIGKSQNSGYMAEYQENHKTLATVEEHKYHETVVEDMWLNN